MPRTPTRKSLRKNMISPIFTLSIAQRVAKINAEQGRSPTSIIKRLLNNLKKTPNKTITRKNKNKNKHNQ